jgi:hypothetical protein
MRSETAVGPAVKGITLELERAATDLRVLHLERLPNADATALARELARGRLDLSDEAVEQILTESQGHPLFIDELVRRRASTPGEADVIRLDDVLWQRVRGLDAGALRFLELTAVAGVPLLVDVVASAAGLDRAAAQTTVNVLQHAHLLRTSGERPATLVSPYHDRVRESVIAHVEPEAIRMAHAQLAVAAEAQRAADPDFLFTHWEGAGNAPRAAEYARVAADRATEALAFARAAALYRRALELGTPSAEARRETEVRLAEALTYAGREAEAAEVRLDLAKTSDPLGALDLRRVAAEQMLISGHFDRGTALLAEVLRAVHERFPQRPLAVLFWLVVVRLVLRVRRGAIRERDPESIDKRALVRIDALWSAGVGFAMTDNIRGAYFQSKNLLLARKVGDVRRAARALSMEVCFRSVSSAKGAAKNLALLGEAKALAKRVGTPDVMALAESASGYVHYFLGNWRIAVDAFAHAEATFRDRCVGVHWQVSSARTMLYRSLAFAGRIEELRSRSPAVVRDATQRGDLFTAMNVLCSTTYLVALADDRVDLAEEALEQARGWLPSGAFLVQHYYHLLAMIQVDLYAGRASAARERLHAAMPTIRRSLLMRVGSFRTLTADAEARIALALYEAGGGDEHALETQITRAIRALSVTPVPWAPPLSRLHEAALAAVLKKRDDAARLLRGAVAALDAAGLDAIAGAARRRLAQLTGDAAILREADAFEAAQGIVRGDAFAAMYAPGFGAPPRAV